MTLGHTYQLIEGALDGEGDAYLGLLERIRPRIVLWCASHLPAGLKTRVEPDDVAQEVLLSIHKGLASFRGRGERPFFAWVFGIARNRIRDLFDYHGALKRQPREALSFTQTTPSRAASRVEAAVRLKQALAELSDDHRVVIRLRRIEERSFAEIAEVMGRREGALRMLYHRALKALAEIVREQDASGVTSAGGHRPEG